MMESMEEVTIFNDESGVGPSTPQRLTNGDRFQFFVDVYGSPMPSP
jgi:hypothetical protein